MTPQAFIYSLMDAAGQFVPSTGEYPAHWVLTDGSVIGLEAVERCETADDLYELLHLPNDETRQRIWRRIQARTGIR